MSWDSLAGPALNRARTWERSTALQSLERCGPKAMSLYQYWNARRGGRAMPSRSDIDPLEMRQWLSRLMLVSVGSEGENFTYRLVGTAIVDLLGVNPTGRPVESAWPVDMAASVVRSYQEVVATRRPVYCQQVSQWLEDQQPSAWSMRLPLSCDGEKIDVVLAYLSDNIRMLTQLYN
jgi:hypothetical protein